MATGETGFDDVTYDLISVQYHALKAGHDYGQYVRDADNAGRQDIADFFRARVPAGRPLISPARPRTGSGAGLLGRARAPDCPAAAAVLRHVRRSFEVVQGTILPGRLARRHVVHGRQPRLWIITERVRGSRTPDWHRLPTGSTIRRCSS